MERSLVAAYWASRKEDANSCAMRTSNFLSALSMISIDLTGWRQTGKTRSEALMQHIYTPEDVYGLEQLFLKGINNRAINHFLWNGRDEDHSSTLSIRCGVHSKSPSLGNAVVLSLPNVFELDLPRNLESLMFAFAESWRPDWVAAASQNTINERGTEKPFLDKALYLKSSWTHQFAPVNVDKLDLKYGALFYSAQP